jgi:UPF0755 protein
VLPTEYALVLPARLRRADRAIKAGNYEIAEGVTLSQLLDKLTQGDVTQIAMTVVEGSTYRRSRRRRQSERANREVHAEAPCPQYQPLGHFSGESRGMVFPRHLFLRDGTKDLELLARGYRLMRSRLDDAWAKRVEDLPLKDPYEALILASIVEKETGMPPTAAGRVGVRQPAAARNAAAIGPHGHLRTRREVRREPAQARSRDRFAVQHVLRDGLPPTPIALPGQASLDAATRPPKTAYLYFVSRGDGTSEFTANLADHNRAVAKFQLGSVLRAERISSADSTQVSS